MKSINEAGFKLVSKMRRHLLLVLIMLVVVVSLIVVSIYLIRVYNFDRQEYHFVPGLHHGMTNYGEAEMRTLTYTQHVLHHIGACKRFPKSVKDVFVFDGIKANEQCKPYTYSMETYGEREAIPPWIDPWGRPYQVRYDRERKKLQLRSQGRYLWTTLDDIEAETFFDGKSYKAQIEHCKIVPSDDMSCVFNRGWH